MCQSQWSGILPLCTLCLGPSSILVCSVFLLILSNVFGLIVLQSLSLAHSLTLSLIPLLIHLSQALKAQVHILLLSHIPLKPTHFKWIFISNTPVRLCCVLLCSDVLYLPIYLLSPPLAFSSSPPYCLANPTYISVFLPPQHKTNCSLTAALCDPVQGWYQCVHWCHIRPYEYQKRSAVRSVNLIWQRERERHLCCSLLVRN